MMFTDDSAVKQAIQVFLRASGAFSSAVVDNMTAENFQKLAAMADAGGKVAVTVVMPAGVEETPTVAVTVRHPDGTATPLLTASGQPMQPTH